jgi:alanine racemase
LGAFDGMVSALRQPESITVSPRLLDVQSPTARGVAQHVRPGMALYGYVSPARGDAPPGELRLTPALTWKASVLEVKDVPKGAHIGYGAGFITPRPMRIGVLAAGYADGLPHRLSGRGRVLAGGAWAPILGAVSMDLTTIDLRRRTLKRAIG